MCLGRTTPHIGGKAFPSFDSLFDSHRWARFSLALHLCSSYVITKWCKNYRKTNWFQKSHEEFGQLQTNSGKSKKLKFDGLLLSKKYIHSAKTFYTEDLPNITFEFLCENSPNSLCHFSNHKSFFTIRIVCIFLAQTLHTIDKSSRSKCKFSDLPLLAIKFTKFISGT